MPPIRTIPFLLQGHLLATISFPRSPSTIRSTNLPIFFFFFDVLIVRCQFSNLFLLEIEMFYRSIFWEYRYLFTWYQVIYGNKLFTNVRIIHICNFEFIYLSMKSILSILILTWQIFLDQLFTFVWKYFYTFIS